MNKNKEEIVEITPNDKNKKQKIIIVILVVILIGVVSGVIFSLHKQQPDMSVSTTQATDWEDVYGAKEEQQNAQKYPDRTLPGIVLE